MTTLDDKLLGEKGQYYYSSSSDDEDSEQDNKTIKFSGEQEGGKEGSVVNTGPKGVINDWRRYKQLETEQNEDQKREMEQLIKRLSMTCKSHLDEEKDKQNVYTPAIKDSTLRRYTISNALSLMQVCKGKNIIISSGAERALEMRGPYDIATLGLLFGLTEGVAKAAVSTNCRSAVLHGETRKTAFGVVYTVKKTCLEEEEAEPVCKKAKKS